MDNRDELFRKYVEGELSAEDERNVLHTLAEDAELRSLLRFELKLNRSFRQEPDLSTFEVPDGFSKNVMREIKNRSVNAETEQTEKNRPLSDWLDWLWQPKQVQWKPAYAVALVLLVTVIWSLPIYNATDQGISPQSSPEQSVQTVTETSDEVWLRFVYIDENANSVAVAGDFSNWDPVSLTREELNGRQVWTGLIPMTRGEHRYMFVKNGDQWVTDPLAPMYREDGFGNKNAVIYL